jgi:hypothetical protein
MSNEPQRRFHSSVWTVAVSGLVVALALSVVEQRPKAQTAAHGLVGTWVLDEAQRTDVAEATPLQAPRGLIIFDAAGHVIEIVSHGRRQIYVANQPTPEEALVTVNSYGGFWGTYKVDDKAGTLSYRVAAGVSPNAANEQLTRSYELTGNRLTIQSRAEPGAQGNLRTRWRRMPVIENLSPAYRQAVGFWEWVGEGSYLMSTGAAVSQGKRDASVIVYSPSGYVGVHFVPSNRKRFAGAVPTPEEARESIAGYVSYSAVLGLYPGHFIHHQLVALPPANNGQSLERDYELRGNEIYLRFAPAMIQGQERQTRVTLRRLSGAAEMLGE